MRSLVRRPLEMDQPIKKFHAYFNRVKPKDLENVINKIVTGSPDVQAKISVAAAVDDEARRVVYFVVEVICEETISEETANLFRKLRYLLREEGLVSLT